eukprot:1762586-Prymnesium_polylepis.1
MHERGLDRLDHRLVLLRRHRHRLLLQARWPVVWARSEHAAKVVRVRACARGTARLRRADCGRAACRRAGHEGIARGWAGRGPALRHCANIRVSFFPNNGGELKGAERREAIPSAPGEQPLDSTASCLRHMDKTRPPR